jgi:lipopolysaccharide export LptBFGC system permease protein LptF
MVLKALLRHRRDALYEQRFNARYSEHLLMLLPLLAFALTSFAQRGSISLLAAGAAALTYLVVAALLYYRVRQQTLAALHREGEVDNDYRPPF